MTTGSDGKVEALLTRVAEALERLAPGAVAAGAPAAGDAFVWEPAHGGLLAVEKIAAVPLRLLKGIEANRDTLLENTRRFADGLPANNALLWGARGMGKSSLVKAVHAEVNRGRKDAARLVLVEIHREEIGSLPVLLRTLDGVAADASALPGPEPAALPTLRDLLTHVAREAPPTRPARKDLRTRLTGSATSLNLSPASGLSVQPAGLAGRGSAGLAPRRATGPPRR